MQHTRKEVSERNVPPEIIDVLLCSWRDGTKKQYNVYPNKWTEFCVQREVNSMRPTVNDVLEFLHESYKKGLAYSTLNTARPALSNFLMGVHFSAGTHYTMTNHPFITRCMKGVFNCRKPLPRSSCPLWTNFLLRNLR